MHTIIESPAASAGAPAEIPTYTTDLGARVGDQVVIHGWVAAVRRGRAVSFLSLRDRSGSVQVVSRVAGALDGAEPESAVRVHGMVRECTSARYGAVEVDAERIEVLAAPTAPVPALAGADAERRSDLRHLDLRNREGALLFEVQSTLTSALREWLLARRFVELHTPKVTAGGSESGAAVFEVDYFGETACLAQSPQFGLQLAMAAGFDRAFEVGPAFRAEAAATNRHATEFTSFDVEVSWIDSPAELMDLAEHLLRDALGAVHEAHGPDVERVFGLSVEVPHAPIPRVPYDEAAATVSGDGDGAGGRGRLTHKAEQALCRRARREAGHSLVFVTGFPAADRPFYTRRGGGGPAGTASFDLLWGGMEVSSGCQREHRAGVLREQALDAGIRTEAMARYLDRCWLPMFEHGCPPHGGFGFGVERLLMATCGLGSIRETSFLFRGPGRFVP